MPLRTTASIKYRFGTNESINDIALCKALVVESIGTVGNALMAAMTELVLMTTNFICSQLLQRGVCSLLTQIPQSSAAR